MFHQTIPQTCEGAQLAVLIAAIQQATPWLRVDGVLAPEQGHLYVLCFDEQHQIIVGFDTLSSWQTYQRLVGTDTLESEVAV